MRNLIAAIALSVAAAIAFASPAMAGNLKLQDQVLSATVQLNGNCSGTVIHSKRDEKSGDVRTVVLTAAHCVDQSMQKDQDVDLPVYQGNRVVKKERYIGRVIGKYYKRDLALIELKDKDTLFQKVARIAEAEPAVAMGDYVITVGYPGGMGLTITEGLFGSYETIDYPSAGTEYFRATPDITGGNSGGAMYQVTAAGDYRLIGVTTAVWRCCNFMGLYTPAAEIHAYLKTALPEAIGIDPTRTATTSPGGK